MKNLVLTTLFLAFISCKNVPEKQTEQVTIIVDSTGLKIETDNRQTTNTKLHTFLENPIDLQEFKKNREVTTSVSKGQEYYFSPNIKDSIFYSYFFPDFRKESTEIDEIVVFKYGKNKHTYDDDTETLIELKIFNPDSDLGKANFFGLTKKELEREFGSVYHIFDKGIAYSNENKVLIFVMKNSKVISYRYIKLNTENIDSELVRKIME